MENEASGSIKLAVNLIVIGALVTAVYILIGIVKPVINERTLSIISMADSEYETNSDKYSKTIVSGTKVINLIRACDDLNIGILYQTYDIKKQGNYAKNIGRVFEGATTSDTKINNESVCIDAKVLNLSSWKSQRSNREGFYTAEYKKIDKKVIDCNNFVNSIFSNTNAEYVNPDGRFYSEIIKDKSGKLLGIIFTQQ